MLDLKKHRRRRQLRGPRRRLNPQKLLVSVGATIALASAVVWLVRDTREIAESFGPSEGSLIVDINTASEAQLVSVPGIAAARAAQIIAGRPYQSVDELDKIAGISGKTLDSLLPFVTVDGETRSRQ